MTTPGDGSRTASPLLSDDQTACTRCDGEIQHADSPRLPQGVSFARWEGWFHVDKTIEHFMAVGWYDLRRAS
jgi:hypothetical protein